MSKIAIDLKSGDIKKEERIIVGIDLGTTNSLIAYINDGQPTVMPDHDGKSVLVPSVIYFDENDLASIGEIAKDKLISDPSRTIFSVKRLMGRSFNDVENSKDFFSYEILDTDVESLVKVKSGKKYYTPVELSAIILKELKARAELVLNQEVHECVITVPAYFNDSQRQATKDAGKLAGWNVLRIVNEPTAAALAYGFDKTSEKSKNIAVYDLGGGTFDLSVLTLEDGIFEVLSTKGDTWLGGDDIDQAILQLIATKFQIDLDTLSSSERQQLRLLAEESKKQLSQKDDHSFIFLGKEITVNKAAVDAAIQPIIQKTIDLTINALKDAELKTQDIDDIIMVGGSTRIPAVKDAVSKFFGKKVNDSIDPDQVVALGAAVQADILAGNQSNLLLLDVTPLSLGIETMGGLMDVIIPRNTKIPSSAGRNYTTSIDGQINLKIAVYQGERDLVQNNRKLGEFILKGIPPMSAGLPKIEVSFWVDADGILIVRAKELRSNTETKVEIKAQYGISEEEMALMLIDSIKNAQTDIDSKALIEARNEAQNVIQSSEKFVKNHQLIFSEEQLLPLMMTVDELRKSIKGSDKDLINDIMHQLDQIGRPLAEIAMDKTIRESLTGKSII
ncbi:MAG: Fe-S protein assembly chaperone HscA [Saprospiraceae bacterium]|jgi:molecular chaperone HscA|uniref:Fe-S protein assembly chaperone HscA n=1 Tax=Candidatus Brachybacter algidus TaxID=2982024 RepID=UPI001B672524|nr:Fe-S protein assembly chaperone HscA [Candidatus Brachybacter algidus]MBP7306031.1 Fe-S protein assembly chaperone HscA [Saprospiraceae bacterium]MBK6448936.1 Fe-S protein assembly chaperone HscA [Candidatus Brachybacter algidus]MBK8601537.1 Fe-S protein assembly chaperone HscA [Candidatus Brachybacter algidus]MBK9025948.1 Fe-S protein assembly chaperone HscA [Candidatus Brachybacter algidus]MBP7539624.1 Fe-S protein assembly chaperone HscA [Saprospiraceae bacterium]